MEKESLLGKFKRLHQALQWTLGGMIGGLVVGIVLVIINGLSPLSIVFWLGFGLFVGALSGAIGWVIYSAVKRVIASNKPM